jgi:hypothetical protein
MRRSKKATSFSADTANMNHHKMNFSMHRIIIRSWWKTPKGKTPKEENAEKK